jgi:hypothetical protein
MAVNPFESCRLKTAPLRGADEQRMWGGKGAKGGNLPRRPGDSNSSRESIAWNFFRQRPDARPGGRKPAETAG